MTSCEAFRQRERARIVSDGARAFDSAPESRCCADCDRWLSGQQLWVETAASLGRLAVPDALRARLATETKDVSVPGISPSTRIASALHGLERRLVPADLEQRLFGAVSAGSAPERVDTSAVAVENTDSAWDEPRVTSLLRELQQHPAPGVLERLVAEELSSPSALTARFIGDMQARKTPPILWSRLVGRTWGTRVRVGGALAAAVLAFLALGFLREQSGTDRPRSFSFEVVRVDSAGDLDPMARSLAAALGGLDPSLNGGGSR